MSGGVNPPPHLAVSRKDTSPWCRHPGSTGYSITLGWSSRAAGRAAPTPPTHRCASKPYGRHRPTCVCRPRGAPDASCVKSHPKGATDSRLKEPRQSGLFPASDGFVLRGFWQADKGLELPSCEGGAADAQRRPAGGEREARFRRAARERMRQGPQAASAPPAHPGGARRHSFAHDARAPGRDRF